VNAGDILGGALGIAEQTDRAAIRVQVSIGRIWLDHAQAVFGQLQVFDHAGLAQVDDLDGAGGNHVVGRFRDHKAGSGHATHLGVALHYQHFFTGAGQVARSRHAVVAGTDDNDVVISVHVGFTPFVSDICL